MQALATTRVASRVAFTAPKRGQLVVLAAHKKGSGSTKNGRDSNAQRRGVKVYGGQPVRAGGIIVRQVGSTWNAGDNCGEGSDYTIFSTVDGVVVFDKKKIKPAVHVYPLDHPKAVAALTATHTKKADGPSRKEKRKAQYTSRRAQGTLAAAQVAVPVQP